MVFAPGHYSSNQQQSQADPRSSLPYLPISQDSTAFRTNLVEEPQQIREIHQKQADTEKLLQAEMEANECTRLINLIVNALIQQMRHRKEPYLKSKSFNELRAYINEYYPELSNQI